MTTPCSASPVNNPGGECPVHPGRRQLHGGETRPRAATIELAHRATATMPDHGCQRRSSDEVTEGADAVLLLRREVCPKWATRLKGAGTEAGLSARATPTATHRDHRVSYRFSGNRWKHKFCLINYTAKCSSPYITSTLDLDLGHDSRELSRDYNFFSSFGALFVVLAPCDN